MLGVLASNGNTRQRNNAENGPADHLLRRRTHAELKTAMQEQPIPGSAPDGGFGVGIVEIVTPRAMLLAKETPCWCHPSESAAAHSQKDRL